MTFDLTGYVDVAERISLFREKYPEGSLQAEVIQWPSEGFPFVAVKAYAYRTEADLCPGTGLAWEDYPGKTPYTKGSELQNAETSAWGRAIVAVLAADTKRGDHIASRQEVERAQAEPRPNAGQVFKKAVPKDVPEAEMPDPCPKCGSVMLSGDMAIPGGPTDKWVCSKCRFALKKQEVVV